MNIFRTKFHFEDIANLPKNIDSDIRKSYYGGIVDVYKPHLQNGYYYDINSLYPYSMTQDMPIDNPILIKGSIDLDKFFGFIYVKVNSPNDQKIPFLPHHSNDSLIVPLGSWEGWYFSEELKYAKNLGYDIKCLNIAYEFKRGKPFDSYVNEFYNIKKDSINKTERNLAKLFLNSLYGKFGMNIINSKIELLNNEQFTNKLIQNIDIKILYPFQETISGEQKGLFNISNPNHKNSKFYFSNVAIASAVTAYSRIIIDKYKRIPNNECFYSDTDSVFLQKPLSKELINNQLGSMKLESYILEAVFISPKLYGYQTSNNEVIKVKGFNNKFISLSKLKELLIPDNKLTIPSISFRKSQDNIKYIESSKILKNTINNKRIPIIKDNLIIDTQPIIINSEQAKKLPPFYKEKV